MLNRIQPNLVREPSSAVRSSTYPMIMLNDLITSGPVERGLYLLPNRSGTNLTLLMDAILRLLQLETEPSFTALSDNTPLVTYFAHRHWRRNSHIGQFFWIDSDYSFNDSQFISEAVQKGLDGGRVLRAISVKRPQNVFHYQELLKQIPSASLFYGMPSVWRTPFVVLSDFISPFLDSKLPEADLEAVFEEFVLWLRHLKKRAIVLAVLKEHEDVPQRRHLIREALSGARWVGVPASVAREKMRVA